MLTLTKVLNKKFGPEKQKDMNKKPQHVSAVLVCAGNSTRMGLQKSKQFIDLFEKPAVYYTLTAFQQSDIIKEVVIVCRECDKAEFENISAKYNFTKITAIVNGGETRSESVKNGICATDENATHVAIHDGARCLITTEEIDKVVLMGITTGAATLGVPVKDTIKVINDDNTIKNTPERSTLRAVQTPQVFDKSTYLKFLDMAQSDAVDFTDDCKLFEYCGHTVTMVDGLYTNIKLTTQDDILLAKGILESRKNK